MNKKLAHHNIIVKKSPTHGFGVFANKTIRKGTIIEECYFILTRGKDTKLEDYYFDVKGKDAVLLGYGSIYNHSDEPNADYSFNMKRQVATLKAACTIPKGKEIFISYGDEWFKDRKIKPKN